MVEEHYRENFKRFVARHARALGWHDAEDAVQNAYVKILEYPPGEGVEFDKYFARVLNNCIKDILRQRKLKGAIDEAKAVHQEAVDPMEDTPEDIHMSREELLSTIGKARKKQRIVQSILILSLLYNRSYDEIHKAYPFYSVVNLRKIVSNFRQELKESRM